MTGSGRCAICAGRHPVLCLAPVNHYDSIVIGAGGVGSAALYHLARRGSRSLGLDRFPSGHDRGSSHGESRIIRQAYFEHPDYVPLCREAYTAWDELSEACGQTLRYETGLLQVGPADGAVIQGVLQSARRHGLEVEQFAASDVVHRFRGFDLPDSMCGVFESRAGYLPVERCVLAHLGEARRLGAELITGVTVTGWQVDGSGYVVETDRGQFAADHIVITAGPWSAGLLADLGVSLEVRRKPMFWFANRAPEYRATEGCPAWLFEVPEGVFYGFPDLGNGTIKVAEHSGGERVIDPLALDRSMRARDQNRLGRFLSAHLPNAGRQVVRHSVCMYTMTPDEHFLVDIHPGHKGLAFAAGLSGHGFKFAPVLGQALADLVLDGRSNLPIGFLHLEQRTQKHMTSALETIMDRTARAETSKSLDKNDR